MDTMYMNNIKEKINQDNSFGPDDTYMRQRIGGALVQVMFWHLFGTKPLHHEPTPTCQLCAYERISVELEWTYRR